MRKLTRPIWELHYLLLALTAFWAVQATSQESTPNLSGIWTMSTAHTMILDDNETPNQEKSRASDRPATNRRIKIEQQGADITITARVAGMTGEEFQKYHFTVGSDDNMNQLMGFPLKSKIQWKDGGLVVDSVATMDNGDLHLSETWTLSPDGQTLTLHERRVMGDRPFRVDTIVYQKQPEADWEPAQPPKMAEEAFKNIQVLKGTPAPELLNAMRSFTRSLGVKCEFCHVEGAFEKDDKPEKQTARKMILMARQINKDNFGGERRVTCWTCHRGATEPEKSPR